MEKTIKSLNIVAAALLIVNLGVELWDRFKPQKTSKKRKASLIIPHHSTARKRTKKKTKTTTTTKSEKGNLIELIAVLAEAVAAVLKNYKKISTAWNKYKSRPPPK